MHKFEDMTIIIDNAEDDNSYEPDKSVLPTSDSYKTY
jgi:hypothetical protein